MKIVILAISLLLTSNAFALTCDDLEEDYKEISRIALMLVKDNPLQMKLMYAKYGATNEEELLENGWAIAIQQCEILGPEVMAQALGYAHLSLQYMIREYDEE